MFGNTYSDVCRRASYEFLKHMYLLQGFELFLHLIVVSRVEINGNSSKEYQVHWSGFIKFDILHDLTSVLFDDCFLLICVLSFACVLYLLCVLSCVFPYDVNIAFFSKLSKYFFVFSSFSVILYNFLCFILVKVTIVNMCVCVFLILARQ